MKHQRNPKIVEELTELKVQVKFVRERKLEGKKKLVQKKEVKQITYFRPNRMMDGAEICCVALCQLDLIDSYLELQATIRTDRYKISNCGNIIWIYRYRKDKNERVCTKAGVYYQDTWNGVTHLVVKSDGTSCADLTMKVMKGIAHGTWVLDENWIINSIKGGHLVAEEDYELKCCRNYKETNVFQQARSAEREKKLFIGFEFFVFPDITGYEDVEELIWAQGGIIRRSAEDLGAGLSKPLVLTEVEEVEDEQTTLKCPTHLGLIKKLYVVKGIPTLDCYFIYHSLAEYQLQPIGLYTFVQQEWIEARGVKQKEIAEFPPATASDVSKTTPAPPAGSDEEEIAEENGDFDCDENCGEVDKGIAELPPATTSDVSMSTTPAPPAGSDEEEIVEENGGCDYDENCGEVDDQECPEDDSSYLESESAESDSDAEVISASEMSTDIEVIERVPILSSVKLMRSGKNSRGKLNNKHHACLYCHKLMPNIARHYELKHRNEKEVAKILSLPRKSKERRKAWLFVVNKGDFAHNYNVLEVGSGLVIPKYRSKSDQSVKSLVPCEICKGFYKRCDLWRHQAKCATVEKKPSGIGAVAAGKLMLPVAKRAHEGLVTNVLAKMQDSDGIKEAVERDEVILQYGGRLYDLQGETLHRRHYISSKMRELGRLLMKAKEKDLSINSIKDLVKSEKWNVFIETVRVLSGYEAVTGDFKTPSLALSVGERMKACAKMLKTNAIIAKDKVQRDDADNFLDLFKEEYKLVATKARSCLEKKRYNKPKLLPLVEDVVKLNTTLHAETQELRGLMSSDPSGVYPKLAKASLAIIILFNRKRSGEAERMKLNDFVAAKQGGKVDPVVMKTLSMFEKQLVGTLLRVEIEGKRRRKVPVLLTDAMKTNLELLVKYRNEAGVQNQEFLFVPPGSAKNPYRGCDVLRTYANSCGCERPEIITSTNLRKQLATLAQILNLKENSQDLLATFQGHDIRVHREFYRIPENVLQIAKVAKLLYAVNNGTVHTFKGLDFDEIEFDLNDAILEDEDKSDDEEDDEEDDEDEDVINDDDMFEIPDKLVDNKTRKTSDSGLKGIERAKGPCATKDANKPKSVEKTRKRAVGQRHEWTEKEKKALEEQFAARILTMGKPPGRLEVLKAQMRAKCLGKLNYRLIVYAVKNLIAKRKALASNHK